MSHSAPAVPKGLDIPAQVAKPGPVIALLVASAFVVLLNETTMGVALTPIMTDLGITAGTAQWLTTAFLLTMAVIIPLTGFILERFELRKVFFAAMSLFTLGTLIAALAQGFSVLLVGRVIQAAGAGIIMPLLMTTVLNVVPANRRGRMMGFIGVVISVAPAIGPTVSGAILSKLSWNAIFWIVLPISLLALALGAIWVQNVTETRPTATFDAFSVVLSALGFGALVYGLSSIGEAAAGHAPVNPLIPVAVGLVALALFVTRQLRLQASDSALLDLRTFQSPTFRIAIVLVVVVMAALFGSLILLPIYLAQVLGLEALTIGLLLLPGGILMGIMAPIIGNLFDRVGPRPLIVPGMIIATLALWGMTTFDTNTKVPWIIAVHLTLNLGLGAVFTPLMTSALGSLPSRLYSHGSAIFGTIQQVAGAAGTAIFVTIFTVTSTSVVLEGGSEVAAKAQGVHAAFLVGAIIASVAVVLTFFVRKPDASENEVTPVAVH